MLILKIILKKLLITKVVNYVGKKVAKAVGGIYVPDAEIKDLEGLLSEAVKASGRRSQLSSKAKIEKRLGVEIER